MVKITRFLLANVFVVAAVLGFVSIMPATAKAACTPDATKQCVSNIVYWYDSCGALQSVAQNCNTTNQVCQNAACVDKAGTTGTTTTTTTSSDYVTSCYNGNLYWFAKDGSVQNMYQSCDDGNSCTLDNCASRACVNQLKCDGSTCAVGSADYAKYCGASTSSTTTGSITQTTGTQTMAQGQGLAIAIFASKNNDTTLQKNITAAANDKINFLIIARNTSSAPIDDVLVQTGLASNITYSGNLKIDTMASAGNITSGIDLGTMAPKISREISFTGVITPVSMQTATQVTSTISAGSMLYDSDYVVLTITGNVAKTAAAPTSAGQGASAFGNFLATWWIWILIFIVLIVVFVIIFRRLSSNV